MDIAQIYEKYNIPPNLQLHMKRVAVLARLIAENMRDVSITKSIIVDACLLHDMGNIIKFDFVNFPQLLGSEIVRLEYWKSVQQNFIERYGPKEDYATEQIITEIGVEPEVAILIKNWGFKNFARIANSDNWNWKIAVYADHRIGPTGLVSLQDNLANKRKRYALNRPNSSHLSADYHRLFDAAVLVESQIAQNSILDLQSIATFEIERNVQKI